jgi:hypothetical protein
MKHIKHISLFENTKPIILIDLPDPIKIMEEFREVLDFPRQNEEGFLVKVGLVDYADEIKGTRFETGYSWAKSNPEILEVPEIKNMMEEWSISEIEFLPNGDVQIIYEPMTKKEWDMGSYSDSGMSYEEYLEKFE